MIEFHNRGVELSVDADGSIQHLQAVHAVCEGPTRLPHFEMLRGHSTEPCQSLPSGNHDVVSEGQPSQCFI